ncbi:MAG: hypothetical protein L0H41_01335 [Microlunatus sp.]|nr:hypothetical protein [Microlunatus sp.]MDN5771608.1 hypothetical protein [Microlunatus sp.]MDN5803301.1 hypothetical protein [Microlunatus sp.]
MDARNTFETPTTAKLARLEWLGFLLVATALTIMHWSAINWWLFVGLFVIIDVIGYLPGRIAHQRSHDGSVAGVYYVLYNTMHCLFTWTVILSAATLLVGWQWAMLAVPLHLLGDRALFGNSLKPFGVPFEPQTHPDFATFRDRYAAAPAPWRPETTATQAEPDSVVQATRA